jgi:hypothetical protein
VDAASGSDENSGTTTAPFATIKKATEAAGSVNGGNVYVAGGVYPGPVHLAPDASLHGGH